MAAAIADWPKLVKNIFEYDNLLPLLSNVIDTHFLADDGDVRGALERH